MFAELERLVQDATKSAMDEEPPTTEDTQGALAELRKTMKQYTKKFGKKTPEGRPKQVKGESACAYYERTTKWYLKELSKATLEKAAKKPKLSENKNSKKDSDKTKNAKVGKLRKAEGGASGGDV